MVNAEGTLPVNPETPVNFPEDISVVIVTHNAVDHIGRTIEALGNSHCPLDRITVVDVASTDGCPDFVESRWSGVQVVRLGSNLGPNPARNLGISRAKTPYVFLMDSDVTVEAGTIATLRDAMGRDESAGIGSPVVLYGDRPEILQYAETGIHYICEAVNKWQGKHVDERGAEVRNIGCASANALLISKAAAARVGMFDERYFLGKDDGDFTHRVNVAGFRILEVPQARVYHHAKSRGTGLFYYQIRNRWHFMLKNYQFVTLLFILPVLLVHEFLQAVLLFAKGNGGAYIKAIAGLMKMVPSLPADRALVSGFRTRNDRDLLWSGPIVMREDFLKNPIMRQGKKWYDTILDAYWKLLCKTVFR